jgi:hypothetical protein
MTMTIKQLRSSPSTTRGRRTGVLAAGLLGLSLLGVTATQSVEATPPLTCNGLAIPPANQVQIDPVTGLPVPFDGTSQSEVIGGTNQADIIHGNGGEDTICGWDGNDVITGDDENDWISGGAGADNLHGDEGDDEVFGNDNNDLPDELFGGDGDDVLRGGDGTDSLSGGNDDDDLHCGRGVDVPADGGPHVQGDELVSLTNHGCENFLNVNP